MIRIALLAVLALWLTASAGFARAVQVSWTISGTASPVAGPLDYFPDGSEYVLTLTFESSTPPTSSIPSTETLYESAIVA